MSSATVNVNEVEIFSPNDFNQQVYILESVVSLSEQNTISVELNSKPGNYFAVEITEDVPVPTVSLSVVPASILSGGSATLTWRSTHADAVIIEPDVGSVDPSGSVSVSPTESITYTVTATGLGGTVKDEVTVTVSDPPLPWR